MTAVTADPILVEHLRARAARDARCRLDMERDELAAIVEDLLDEERRILTDAGREALVAAVVDEALGLGPLDTLLRDPRVTEIMVCGPARVFVEREGLITATGVRFADDAHLLHVIDRILSPLGRRVDEASPMVDARLPDRRRGRATQSARRDQGERTSAKTAQATPRYLRIRPAAVPPITSGVSDALADLT